LREAITKYKTAQLERQHRRGYEKQPVERDEFALWESDQEWGRK
jgi:hypothetical protein